jgi:hypothetical protein
MASENAFCEERPALRNASVALIEWEAVCIRCTGSRRSARHVDAFLRSRGVFEHERGDPCPFAVLEGLNDSVMLAVVVPQRLVHARRVDPIECDGVRGCKGYPSVALDRFGDYLATGSFDDKEMELLVHVAVPGFVRVNQMPFGKNLVAFSETLMQGM